MHEVIDNLDDRLMRMTKQVEWHGEKVEELQELFLQKANEKTVAHYFEKVANGLPKDLGDPTPEARSYFQDSKYEELY